MGMSISIADPFQVHVGHVRPAGDMAWREDGTLDVHPPKKAIKIQCGAP